VFSGASDVGFQNMSVKWSRAQSRLQWGSHPLGPHRMCQTTSQENQLHFLSHLGQPKATAGAIQLSVSADKGWPCVCLILPPTVKGFVCPQPSYTSCNIALAMVCTFKAD
jgi:hypothetical protein